MNAFRKKIQKDGVYMPKIFQKDSLLVEVFPSRSLMGQAATCDIEAAICKVISDKDVCNVIFAAAPSQNEVLAGLAASSKIDWRRVHAFHMDEYVGISHAAPQGFANFLRTSLFDKVPMGGVEYLDCTAEPKQETQRYAGLLAQYPADLVVMGIGENGHIAFNDPHVANFQDPLAVKTVALDEKCRLQQVHDGCFEALDAVPTHAMTLTIPTLFRPAQVFCIVPAKTKAQAVYHTLNGPVSETCPASILRRHPSAVLYLDPDSASQLELDENASELVS